MESNDKKEYQESLSSFIFRPESIDDNILYNLIDALCNIAIFEWPENYQNFSELFCITDDTRIMKITLRIISIFFEKIDITNIITDLRKNNLRQYVITNYREPIFSIITNFLMNTEFSNDVLSIFNYLLRWDSMEDIITFETFQQLILQLLPNELTCENTIKCLKTIFLQRNDSINAFNTLSPFLIDALAKSTFQSQSPVTTNASVIQFLLKFLEEYSWILEIVLIYDQITQQNQNDENAEPLIKTMQENDFNPSVLHEDLIYLYQVILSIPPEEIVDEIKTPFWNLWQKNLRNILNEQQSHCPVILSSSSFFLPFFDEITKSLFNSLISFADDKEENFYQIESILTSIYSINPDNYVNFLKEQSPSPQLCFSIAAFEFNIDDSKQEKILLIIVELFQCINGSQQPSSEFQSSLLFGLSHCAKFFRENGQLFSQFIEFMLSAMTGNDEAVSTASTRAFKYIVSYNRDLFKKDAQNIVETIVNESENFLLNMETESSKRVFKSCTVLIENSFATDSQFLCTKLFEPIMSVICKPDQFDQETVEKAISIISKCFRDSSLFSTDLFDSFWPPLFQFAANTIPDTQFPASTINLVLIALGHFQLNLEYDQISSQIEDIFNMMKRRGRIEEGFFLYFEIVRTTHDEIDSMYQFLHQELVLPYLVQEDSASIELFDMVGKFSPDSVGIEWLTEIVLESAKNLDQNVGSEALDVYQSMISELSVEQRIDFLTSIAPKLIDSLIEMITDLIHKTLFRFLVNTLRSVLSLVDFEEFSDDEVKSLPSSFIKIIVSSLNKVANEPEQGFFENFAHFLFSILGSRFEFYEAFTNLLVVLKKASPCDAKLFKIESQKESEKNGMH